MWKFDLNKIFKQGSDQDFKMIFIPVPEFQEEMSILICPPHFSEIHI